MKIEIQLNQITLLIKGLCLLDRFFVCGMMCRFGDENIIHFTINHWNHYWSIAHSGH